MNYGKAAKVLIKSIKTWGILIHYDNENIIIYFYYGEL